MPDNRTFWRDTNAQLPPPMRLSISYAPAAMRPYWHGLFLLDRRFASLVAGNREPMLAQMKLAWWRETLSTPAAERPAGEPLLGALAYWDGERAALSALADGWEALVGEPPLDAAAFAALAGARAGAVTAMLRLTGNAGLSDVGERLAYRWALADVASNLSDRTERDRAAALLRAADAKAGRVPRILRPIAALDAVSRRAFAEGRAIGGAGDFATMLRIGILGR